MLTWSKESSIKFELEHGYWQIKYCCDWICCERLNCVEIKRGGKSGCLLHKKMHKEEKGMKGGGEKGWPLGHK